MVKNAPVLSQIAGGYGAGIAVARHVQQSSVPFERTHQHNDPEVKMSFANGLVRGAVSGLIATLPMTAAIYAGKELGLLVRPPPREVTHHAEKHTNVEQHLSQSTFTMTWLAAHFGFGASAGLVYSLVRPLLPSPTLLAGLAYGSAVWALFYTKILPDLGLYPPPQRDRLSRTATMVAAHFVFGSVTALLFRALPRNLAPVVEAAKALPEVAHQ